MNEKAPIRVLIVDDHPVVRGGLSAIISDEPDMAVVGEAGSGRETIELFERLRPDVTVLDLSLPDINGVDVIGAVRKKSPDARFLVLTIYEGHEDVYRALEAGARAYLLKEVGKEELLKTVRTVHRGGRYVPARLAAGLASLVSEDRLTPRELGVLRLLAAGERNGEIAGDLGISPETVKTHIKSILSKLGVNSRSKAIALALRSGLVHHS